VGADAPGARRLRLRREGEREGCHAMAAVVPHSGGRASGAALLRAASEARRRRAAPGRHRLPGPHGTVGLCQAPAGVRRSGKRTVDGRTRKNSRSPYGDVMASRDVLPGTKGAGRKPPGAGPGRTARTAALPGGALLTA